MITAEEFLINKGDADFRLSEGEYISEIMIEFAQLHVKEALYEASEQAKIQYDYSGNTGSEFCDEYIDKDSILNAYPYNNIK
jgi:hypothetical protein